ncbi:MAG: ORF6N domain-containing protein [Verrucomicrobiae bacterium]|nr:ORF6N domain-containing protein [Verrucomicrobiae bacterium]
MSNQSLVRVDRIGSLIRTIRGKKVILDADLARIYGVPTKRLNEQVKRNAKRFPSDFLFQLTAEEAETELRSRSQIATLKRGMNVKYLPYVFTENGAIMAANVLNSPEAVRMSVFVVRAFVQMRELLGSTKELARQLADLEKKLTARLDGHEVAIVEVLRRVMDILDPPPLPEPPRREIGFHVVTKEQQNPKPRRKKKA